MRTNIYHLDLSVTYGGRQILSQGANGFDLMWASASRGMSEAMFYDLQYQNPLCICNVPVHREPQCTDVNSCEQ